MATKMTKAIVINPVDGFSASCLHDIRGLKEGDVVQGRYNAQNNAFDFKWQGNDATLWVDSNASLYKGRKRAIN